MRLCKFNTIALLSILTLSPLQAQSGTLTGTIESILFNKDISNMVFIQIQQTSPSARAAPTCAVGQPGRMVMDITTPVGKALLGNLMALKLSNSNTVVSLVGTDSCTLWGDTESFSYTFL